MPDPANKHALRLGLLLALLVAVALAFGSADGPKPMAGEGQARYSAARYTH